MKFSIFACAKWKLTVFQRCIKTSTLVLGVRSKQWATVLRTVLANRKTTHKLQKVQNVNQNIVSSAMKSKFVWKEKLKLLMSQNMLFMCQSRNFCRFFWNLINWFVPPRMHKSTFYLVQFRRKNERNNKPFMENWLQRWSVFESTSNGMVLRWINAGISTDSIHLTLFV